MIKQKEMYNMIKAIVANNDCDHKDELLDFIESRIDKLENRSDTSKPTKKQLANADIKNQIVDFLTTTGKAYTCTELYQNTDFGLTSATHASALLKQLVDSNIVTKVYDKKVAKFSIG